MATKSISQLDSASTMALGDLLEIAEPNAQSVSGYTSKKISIGSQLAPYIQGTVQNASLNTTDKTLVGAINEVDSEGVKWSENNVLGAKNLLKYPYYYNSQVINGITWTVNADGTVKATGTATANSSFYLHLRNEGESNDFVLPNGTYIISDGLATHSSNIEIQMGITKNGAYSEVALTRNGDVQFTANGDDYSQNSINPLIQCLVRSGQQNVNVTFKPMIRLASIADSTFEPYAQTNRQLTLEKVEITEIAPSENGDTASQAYAIGDYMFFKGGFYKVTSAISSGGAITVGTNITKTTIGAELKAALS